MPSSRAIESTQLRHPVLGPAVAIRVGRGQVRAQLVLAVVFFAVSLFGVAIGLGDFGGNGFDIEGVGIPAVVEGSAQIAAALVVMGWALRTAVIGVRRTRRPYFLVVGREGFDHDLGHGPVSWSEVDDVRDPRARSADLAELKVQLADPHDYAERHRLWKIDRLMLRFRRNNLNLANASQVPVDLVEELMRKRLAEFRHEAGGAPEAVAGSGAVAAKTRAATRPHKPARRH